MLILVVRILTKSNECVELFEVSGCSFYCLYVVLAEFTHNLAVVETLSLIQKGPEMPITPHAARPPALPVVGDSS